MSPRILVVGQLPPPVHGSNVMTERCMDALRANGFDAMLVEKPFSRTLEEVGKISPRKAAQVPPLCRKLLNAAVDARPGLCLYFISVGLPALLVDSLLIALLRQRGIPYVLYFHGRGYRDYQAARYRPVAGIVRRTLAGALGGLVLGEGLKSDVGHHIPEERLYVLPNGIPDIRPEVCRPRNGAAVTVGFLGNLIPSKGPMTFLEMAKRVVEKDKGVRFAMAGRHVSEAYLRDLRGFVAREGLAGFVELSGPRYGTAKDRFFQEADIFVFPTAFRKETFALVNVEAMQWGLPVISSPVGAIPEVVRDGETGFIVDPADIDLLACRVLKLAGDPELRGRMGRAARQRYEDCFSLEAYGRNLKQAMDRFIRLNAASG